MTEVNQEEGFPGVPPEEYARFMSWAGKQDRIKLDAYELMEQCVVWSDEAPEDEREWSYPADLQAISENFLKFLEIYRREVAKATLSWISENLYGRLEQSLEEDAELEVFMDQVIKEFKEENHG